MTKRPVQRDENPEGIHLPLPDCPATRRAAGWSVCCGAASLR